MIIMTVTLFFDNYIAFKNRPFAYRISRSSNFIVDDKKKKFNFFIRDICLFSLFKKKKRSTKNAQSLFPRQNRRRKEKNIYVRIFSSRVCFSTVPCSFRLIFFFCINFIFHDSYTNRSIQESGSNEIIRRIAIVVVNNEIF